MADFGIVYIAKNKVNGKCYVGQTVRSLARRRANHRDAAIRAATDTVFGAAIRKYGIEVFEFSILQACCGRECLNYSESWWISHLKTVIPNGYNLTLGGEGFVPSEETRKKMSAASKRRATPERMKELNALCVKALKGTKWTPERHAIRSARETPLEERLKISEANKGKKRSEESRARISAGKIGKPQPWMAGNQHAKGNRLVFTEEHKRKIATAKTGKPRPDMIGNRFGKRIAVGMESAAS